MRKLKNRIKEDRTFNQKGAIVILWTMIMVPLLGWTSVTIVGAVERISSLEAKEYSQRQLILRVDRKIDIQTGTQNEKFKRVNDKLDQIMFRIKK